MKNKLKAKRSFFSLPEGVAEYVGIVLTVLVAFVGTYFYLPHHGIVSSLPIVILCAFVCTFFKLNEGLKVSLFFIMPFFISTFLGESVKTSLFIGILCGVFYILAYGAVLLFKKKNVKYTVFASLLVVISLCIHVFSNSTPFDVTKNNKALSKYITENYSGEPLSATDVKFNAFDRSYGLFLVPQHDAGISLNVVAKDGKIIRDDFVDYSEKYNMLVGAGRITYVIREMFPDLNFTVESNRIYGYPFSTSATVTPAVDYSRYMDFSVYFTSYNGAKEFTELAEQCYRTLLTSGFCCRSITFYGGIGTRYIAKINVPFDSFKDNLENFVEPCDNDVFLYTSLK